MAPRPRKPLDPKSHDFGTRFGLHLRSLLDKRNLGPSEFLSGLKREGVDVSSEAVRKWLAGDRLPRPQDMEQIGRVLRLKDYRHVLPPST